MTLINRCGRQIHARLCAGTLTITGFLVVTGLTAGCSRDSAVDTAAGGVQPVPRRTTTQAAETIKNDPGMSPEDKDKYLRQLKENDMAERMNPNGSASGSSGPVPGQPAAPR